MLKKLFLIIVGVSIFLPGISSAIDLNLDYPAFTVGGKTFDLNTTQNLNDVVAWFYYFIVTISGFAAFVMLVYGGFKYLSSAGNPSAIGDSKDIIQKALLGLLLILISYLVLQVINPDLVLLQPPKLQ
ncbi:MAG: hypothetical protein Q7S70_02545 [bacterium]|nr:hypothetical protein [bacterium]